MRRYNAVQFITILPSELRWQQKNANQTSNSNGQPITRPHGRAMGCLLWGFGRKLTALKRHRTVSWKYIFTCYVTRPEYEMPRETGKDWQLVLNSCWVGQLSNWKKKSVLQEIAVCPEMRGSYKSVTDERTSPSLFPLQFHWQQTNTASQFILRSILPSTCILLGVWELQDTNYDIDRADINVKKNVDMKSKRIIVHKIPFNSRI